VRLKAIPGREKGEYDELLALSKIGLGVLFVFMVHSVPNKSNPHLNP
jgi:hypothetical protein